ncbi:hypothetical protein [Streptomyces zingiberis]|uniref:Uncharacterized protein n=1 Tax=Streptomyces zingiberis TaxID=2053010 RepID=A0ABX1BYB6_9ACTN|nr:hypothetical protein [Streptomyces zingiberis]NJQ02687.1 hypothetical protein [Streptomyces zingiberis]
MSGVLRVSWMPGSDQLLGVCHCGAEQVAESPAEVWEWLLAHPEGHHAPGGPAGNGPGGGGPARAAGPVAPGGEVRSPALQPG